MQIRFVQGEGWEVDSGLSFLQPADAAPDRNLLAFQVSLRSPIKVSAVGAINQMGQCVLPAVHSPLSYSSLRPLPAHHLLAHLQEELPREVAFP